jgi:hypothetical protein
MPRLISMHNQACDEKEAFLIRLGFVIFFVWLLVASSAVVAAPSSPPSTLPPTPHSLCGPMYTTEKQPCFNKMASCATASTPIKWTGRGCRGEFAGKRFFATMTATPRNVNRELTCIHAPIQERMDDLLGMVAANAWVTVATLVVSSLSYIMKKS